jgi:phosphatidate cytidylyltransferase
MLRWRLTLGAIFIAGLAALIFFDVRAARETTLPPGLLLLPVALTIAIGATREYLAWVRTRSPEISGTLLIGGNWLIAASPWLAACSMGTAAAGRGQLIAFTAILLVLLVFEVKRYDKDSSQRVTERIALTLFGFAYIGLLLSFIVRLRMSPQGIVPLLMMLVVVKAADIGAYTIGRLFGKHKMAPKLSPGKTWEGFVGGLAFAVVGAMIVAYFTGLNAPLGGGALQHLGRFVPFALVVGTAGVIGDLVESLLKRDFGRKDSSDWMPGFGGVLDLIDSPLLAAPVACLFWEGSFFAP